MSEQRDTPDASLDPEDWESFRARAHKVLDQAISRLESAREGPVWREPTPDLRAAFDRPLPDDGFGAEAVDAQMSALLPFGVGNTHPRFFGWVHGAGTPAGLVSDMIAGAMNANLGGRDHGAIEAERQVIRWCRDLFGMPSTTSGLVVSGTSIATFVALKSARDAALGQEVRQTGVGASRLTGYCSATTHSCAARAFDMLGLGSKALRTIPTNDNHQMDLKSLAIAVAADRAAGVQPFVVIATAGSVDLGAIDDLSALADFAEQQSLWYHGDGAFGAMASLSETHAPRLKGIERAHSLVFDFHKWLHVNYDAGLVLVSDETLHRQACAERPSYLQGATRGLAAGNPWPVDYGPELSRGFRALKVWAHLAEFGPKRLGAAIARNCAQAAYLGEKIA